LLVALPTPSAILKGTDMIKQVQWAEMTIDPFAPRKSAPTERPDSGADLSYVVWSHHPAYLEDDKPWKVCAAFRFLQEALDYIAYVQDVGGDVVFQSPADVKEIKHTDRRVVYKPQ